MTSFGWQFVGGGVVVFFPGKRVAAEISFSCVKRPDRSEFSLRKRDNNYDIEQLPNLSKCQPGVSYLRLVMGASDLMAVPPYTYDDLPNSHDTDFGLDRFSIDKDRAFVIPILKVHNDR